MLNKQEYRKQLEEELEREKIKLDPKVIDAFVEIMHSQQEALEAFLSSYDIEERIIKNLAPDDSIVDTALELEECYHNWKKYTGLRETFEYCEFCGIKKT